MRGVTRCALASVTSLLVLAGCGQVAQDRATALPPAQVDGESLLAELGVLTSGTLEDQLATRSLQYMRFQGAIRTCMQRAGYSYTPPIEVPSGLDTTLRPQLTGFHDVLIEIAGSPGWPADLRIGRTARTSLEALDALGLALGELAPNPGYESLNESERAGYDRQLDACVPTHDQPSPTPAVATSLQQDLRAAIDDVIANDAKLREMLAGYGECMASHGFRGVTSRAELGEQLAAAYSSDALAYGLDSDAWRADERRELDGAAADAACRTEAHERAIAVVTPLLVEWRASHASELQALSVEWANLRSTEQRERAAFSGH